MPEQLAIKNPTDLPVLNDFTLEPANTTAKTKKRNNPMNATKFFDAKKAKEVVEPAVGFIAGAAASSMLNKNIAPRLSNINLQRAARVGIPIVGGMITLGLSRKEFAKRVAYGMGITAVYEGISVAAEMLGNKVPLLNQVNNMVNPNGNTDTGVAGWVQPTLPASSSYDPYGHMALESATTSASYSGADVAEITSSTIEEV